MTAARADTERTEGVWCCVDCHHVVAWDQDYGWRCACGHECETYERLDGQDAR